jgi:hypothetical protein
LAVSETVRKKKRAVGAVAIVLLLVFTVLAIAQIISFWVWIIGDLVVALVANLMFKQLNKQTSR